MTFRQGRLGAADYAPGLLGSRAKNFFQKFQGNFSKKKCFFQKTILVSNKIVKTVFKNCFFKYKFFLDKIFFEQKLYKKN